MTEEIDLKPCPFCGGKPFVWRTRYDTVIECENYNVESHRVMMQAGTDEKVAELWNRRAGEEREATDDALDRR